MAARARPSMRIAPFGTAINERVAKRDQSVGFTEWRSPLIERLGVRNNQGKLVFVKDGRSPDLGPEVRRHRKHSLTSNTASVRDVTLHFQV